MLEKHIQLMHGIKDPDLKEMTEAANEEEVELKEDTKVRHYRGALYSEVVPLTCFFPFIALNFPTVTQFKKFRLCIQV